MTLLSMLMMLMIFWFGLIMRVLIRVVKGAGAADNRSDDESEDSDEVDSELTGKQSFLDRDRQDIIKNVSNQSDVEKLKRRKSVNESK